LLTIFDATVAAMHTPEASAAFTKQTFNIVPNTSLADAKTWLAQQIEHWRKITSEVQSPDGVSAAEAGGSGSAGWEQGADET
jgi:hypothetical protein